MKTKPKTETRAVVARRLERGDVVHDWAEATPDAPAERRLVAEVTTRDARTRVTYADYTSDLVRSHAVAHVATDRDAAHRHAVLAMLDDREARKWRRTYGRSELADRDHIPLGWVPLFMTETLRALVEEDVVEIVELSPRASRRSSVAFLVRRDSEEVLDGR